MNKSKFCLLFVILLTSSAMIAKNNATNNSNPPIMGWASWNHFHMDINEKIIKGQADAMVTCGLSALGYKYINIDDGFFNGRYADGTLRLDTVKFPNGMKAVANYIHFKGLKAGFYTEAGSNTCGSMYDASTGGVGGGLYNHEQQDMDLFFKNWGFDFLKIDYCGAQDQRLDEETRYTAIRKAMDNTGVKSINLNICRWQFPGTWVTKLADSWRISADIKPEWGRVCEIIDKNTYLAPYASPGHYNDMDMLEVGRGMSMTEDKTHFSMWCMLGSPLMLGNDLTNVSVAAKSIISNAEIIALNQDISGEVQARLILERSKGLQVWGKRIHGKQSCERAVILFNRTNRPEMMTVKWVELDLVGPAKIRDLWSHTDLGEMESMYAVVVPAHGVSVVKIIGKQSLLQEDFEAEYAWINNYNLTRFGNVLPGQGNVVKDTKCSGGAKATWLGNDADNYIEFRNIYTNKAGNYNLILYYVCSNERDAVLTVNGSKKIKLSKLCSYDWKEVATLTLSVQLVKGENTIRFSNNKNWLPDLDKIHLNLNEKGK